MAQDIESLLAALRGDGLSKAADEISAKIQTGAKLSNSALKVLSNARAKNNREMDEALKKIKAYEEDAGSMTKVDKADYELQKKIFDQRIKGNRQIGIITDSTNKLSEANETQTKTQSKTIESIKSFISSMNEEVTVLGLLDRAFVGLEYVQGLWFQSQTELTAALGAATRQAGMATSQVEDLEAAAGNMRSTFQTLGGSLIGWTDSIAFANEAQMAFRTSIGSMSEQFQLEVLATERGLGMSAEQTAQLFRTLQTGLADGNESLGDFTLDLREFAASIGANSNQLAQDFIASSNSLQRFGRNGTQVFREVALFANRFGMETERVLQMSSRFDQFGAASDNINQLNSMFGTTISSLELMQTTDPIERIEMITNSIRDQGIAWNDMDFAQQRSLAASLGISEAEAGRVMMGEDMAAIQREQAAREQTAEAQAQKRINQQDNLLNIISATSTRFMSWGDQLERIYLVISDSLAPIFEALHLSSQDTASSLMDMVQSVVQSPEFESTVRNIANFIKEMPPAIEMFRPVWETIRDTAIEMWPMIQEIGRTLMEVFQEARTRFGPIWEQIKDTTKQMKPIWDSISSTIAWTVDKLVEAFSPGSALMNGISYIAGTIGGFANGVGGLLGVTSNEIPAPNTGSIGSSSSPIVSSAPQPRNSTRQMVGNSIPARTQDYRQISESALAGGASPTSVIQNMVQTAAKDPAQDFAIRNSFGISRDEDLAVGLSRKFSQMSAVANEAATTGFVGSTSPVTSTGTPAVSSSSAVESAPTTMRTANLPGQTNQQMQIVASDVVMDGKQVGKVFFQISARA